MKKSRMPTMIGALALASVPLCAAQAQALRVGMLTCDVSGGVGAVVTSSKQIDCLFSPSDGSAPERYVGAIDRFGLDVGITGPGKLAWGVFASTAYPGPGVLQGVYTGPTGGATIGAGATANYLLGGSQSAFSLQALSISGQTGLNVTAGVARLTLQLVPLGPLQRARKYRRHRRA